jgi:hypothetical protein
MQEDHDAFSDDDLIQIVPDMATSSQWLPGS